MKTPRIHHAKIVLSLAALLATGGLALQGQSLRAAPNASDGGDALVVAEDAAGAPARPSMGVRWRTGVALHETASAIELRVTLGALVERPEACHLVVQFSELVDPALRERVRASGMNLLSYLGDNAFFAAIAPSRADVVALASEPTLVYAGAVEPVHRLHPLLAEGKLPSWAVVRLPALAGEAEPTVIGAYVMLHPDVALRSEGESAVVRHGAVVRSRLESINGLVIELPLDNIPALALEDAVQWIEPPLPQFSVNNNSNRAITGADVVH